MINSRGRYQIAFPSLYWKENGLSATAGARVVITPDPQMAHFTRRRAGVLVSRPNHLRFGVLLASRGRGTLNEHRLQPWGAFSDAGRAPLAGTLVETRNETRPGQEMSSCRELAHVRADLGEEDLGRGLAQTRDFLQSLKGITKGRERGLARRRPQSSLPAAQWSLNAGR